MLMRSRAKRGGPRRGAPGRLSSGRSGVAIPEMGGAALEQPVVGIAHRLRLAAAEHDLEIHRLQAVVLIAVDPAGRARHAFPRAEPRGDALAALVLDEH